MEGRKLNFNAPLLSVRRYSVAPVVSSVGKNGKVTGNSRPGRQYTIPFYRSELNLEQVTEPATVPFLWEQIPGRPKDGDIEPQQPEEASVTPRLAPRRTLDIVKYPLEKEFDDRPQTESCYTNEIVSRLDTIKQANNEKGNSGLENDDDDDDDVYTDALDALSPTDSFSMNCSVSGLSGSDGEVVKPSGSFSTDPQTRDFMMRRFLPAAKAMALEPPQYASRKQPAAAIEQTRVVNKVVSEDRKPSLNQSIVIPHYGQDVDEEESEDEVEEYDETETGDISSKACGLLPRLCLNKSLCLLNPVPGLRVRTHSSISSTSDSEVRKRVKAAYVEPHVKTVKKSASDVAYKHQSDIGGRSPKLLGIENKMTCGSNRFAHTSEQQMMTSRSSPFRRGISPYRNERNQSPFRGGGFLGVPKETDNLKSNRLNLYGKASSKSQEFPRHSFNKVSGSMSPAVEKTLYIDTVKFAKISCSDSSPSETKGLMGSVAKSSETPRSRETEQDGSAEFSLQDQKCQDIAKEGSILESKVFGSVGARRSFSGMLHPRSQADAVECLDPGLDQECNSLECIKITADGNLDSRNEKNFEVDDSGYINSGFEQSPLPPPLPKTPSESWLWRTLPSVPSRNPFSHSYAGTRFNPKKQDAKLPLTSAKWETIVKTSHSHYDHSCYSEELTSLFSNQSKT